MSDPVQPDGFEIFTSRDGESILIRFLRDGAEPLEVELSRDELTTLVAALVGRIGSGQATPIDVASLRSGRPLSVIAHQLHPGPRSLPNDLLLEFHVLRSDVEPSDVVAYEITRSRQCANSNGVPLDHLKITWRLREIEALMAADLWALNHAPERSYGLLNEIIVKALW